MRKLNLCQRELCSICNYIFPALVCSTFVASQAISMHKSARPNHFLVKGLQCQTTIAKIELTAFEYFTLYQTSIRYRVDELKNIVSHEYLGISSYTTSPSSCDSVCLFSDLSSNSRPSEIGIVTIKMKEGGLLRSVLQAIPVKVGGGGGGGEQNFIRG